MSFDNYQPFLDYMASAGLTSWSNGIVSIQAEHLFWQSLHGWVFIENHAINETIHAQFWYGYPHGPCTVTRPEYNITCTFEMSKLHGTYTQTFPNGSWCESIF